MTSIVGHASVFPAGEALPAWAKFDWNNKVQHDIYRDWGEYYANRRRENFANYYYTQALELNEYDYMTLYRRSLTKGRAAQIEESLNDARSASEMASNKRRPNCPINLQICDALFQLNQFENSNSELYSNMRRFWGVKSKNFDSRRVVVEGVIQDVTGKSLSLFYLKNQKIVKQVSEMIRANEKIDDRPMWKILKDLEKCDILSIPEVKEEILCPLEIARRKRVFNVIHQNYLNEAWHDVLFLKRIRKNPSLLLDQCKGSKQFLETLSRKQYDVIRRFIKMIHSRSPLYHVSFLKYSNKKMMDKNKEAYLFHIQYQTHRNMIHDLRQIRKLRKERRIKELADHVEKIMGDYYVTKTNRVMCWKFEFVNEVYNTLGLALCEQYTKSRVFKSHSTLFELLNLPEDKIKDMPAFIFGDRSTYQDGDIQDPAAIRARKLITRLESRIRFSKYGIEKSYLYHQIASTHLSQLHYDECCFNARRAIKESRHCNSNMWHFLSMLQIIMANTLQHKVERIKDSIEETTPVAIQLKSRDVLRFMDALYYSSEEAYRRKTETLASQISSRLSIQPSYLQ